MEPKYCPRCGAADLDVVEVGDGEYAVYDVFCRDCGFSGDISPDILFSDEEE